jgi:hypothetical protein
MALCLHRATMTKIQYNWLKLSFKLPRVSTIIIQIQNGAFVYILAILIYYEFNSGCTAHLFFLFKNSSKNNISFFQLVSYSLCNSCGKCIVQLHSSQTSVSPHTFLSTQLPTVPKTSLTPVNTTKYYSCLLNDYY